MIMGSPVNFFYNQRNYLFRRSIDGGYDNCSLFVKIFGRTYDAIVVYIPSFLFRFLYWLERKVRDIIFPIKNYDIHLEDPIDVQIKCVKRCILNGESVILIDGRNFMFHRIDLFSVNGITPATYHEYEILAVHGPSMFLKHLRDIGKYSGSLESPEVVDLKTSVTLNILVRGHSTVDINSFPKTPTDKGELTIIRNDYHANSYEKYLKELLEHKKAGLKYLPGFEKRESDTL